MHHIIGIESDRIEAIEKKVAELSALFSEYIQPRLTIPEVDVKIDIAEAAKICQYKSKSPIRKAIEDGKLTAYGSVGSHRVLLSEVIKWKNSK